jgi:hypothetical protein
MRNKSLIEVRFWHPNPRLRTAYGTVYRVITEGKYYTIRINNERKTVQDPHGECFVFVDNLPRDLDKRGYE